MQLTKLGEELYVPENFGKYHHYYADAEGTKEYTGITTILGVIAKPALIGWAAKMATEYIRENVAYAIPGEDGGYWAIKPSVVEEARTAHAKKRDTAADKGTELHALVETLVQHWIDKAEGKPIGMPADWGDEAYKALTPFMLWAGSQNIRFIAAEQRLYSKTHWIAGTCDLVFEKDGKRYIGDIKTYKKIWDRVPLIQCAGYALMWEEMFNGVYTTTKQNIDGYCVVCLPKERAFNEAEDVLWSWDTEGDREAFISAARLYRYLKQK
jgi:hypothetical protein